MGKSHKMLSCDKHISLFGTFISWEENYVMNALGQIKKYIGNDIFANSAN